ncbi:hypothetical protein ACVXZZ_15165 [Staphylococcus aureus]
MSKKYDRLNNIISFL